MTAIGKAIDLAGQRFGRLTAIERRENVNENKTRWLCRCDCGTEKVIQAGSLRSGATRSCGCLQREWATQRGRLQSGVAAFNSVYRAYVASARRKGLAFRLTKEQVRTLTKSRCHYCGTEPCKARKGYNGEYVFNGIDRIDSQQGYEMSNVVPCCSICNLAKSNMPYSEFIEYLDRLSAFRQSLWR